VLAVEAYSPSTKRIDRGSKLFAFDLVDGRYVEVARLAGAQRWMAGKPFPVELCPDDLVAGLRPDPTDPANRRNQAVGVCLLIVTAGRRSRPVTVVAINSIESFQGLTGNLGNELEVLVHVEHGQAREFAGCRYQKIWDRWAR